MARSNIGSWAQTEFSTQMPAGVLFSLESSPLASRGDEPAPIWLCGSMMPGVT
jgi:hypothetical protein